MRTFEVIYREAGRAEVVRKEIKSVAEALVRHDLESQGCQVLAILPRRDSGIGAFFRRIAAGEAIQVSIRFGVSTAELALFCEVLKALYSSGVPMLQSLQIVIEETPNPWFRKRLRIVLDRLRDGADVYEAMCDPRCVKAFPPMMRETIRTGEANGRLDRSLERLAEIFKRMAETKRETISATMYPAFAFLLFIVVCTVIAVMVPDALQEAVGGEEEINKIMVKLDASMRLLFFLRRNPQYLAVPPGVLIAIAIGWIVGKRYSATRLALTRIERKIPLLGKVLYQFALVRFLDLLASNNETGIQVSESLRLIGGSVDDALIEGSLERMRERILTAGSGLGQAMSAPEESTVFPGIVRQMVRAGEESGQLTEMLLPIVAFYGDQARATLKRTLDMLTPTMIVLLGSVIGPVILGLYKALIILQDAAALGMS